MITFICVCGLSEVNGYAYDGGGSGINFPLRIEEGLVEGYACCIYLYVFL